LDLIGYRIDLDNVIKSINKNDYKTVVLQIPEGLKTQVKKIVDYFEERTNSQILIHGQSCFGACDLIKPDDYSDIDIDAVVQIGHTSIPDFEKQNIPYFFVNAESKTDATESLKKTLKYLEGKTVGLCTTAQHLHEIDKIKNFFEENNINIVIEKGDSRIKSPGQILGCNFSSAKKIGEKIDVYLYIGSGVFHPLGLILSTDKPIISFDPYSKLVKTEELENIKDTVLRQRYGAIANCKNAKTFAVVVCNKTGQQRYSLAKKLKEKIEKSGKKAYIVVLDFFSPFNLESFRGFDCFVSTACPRIAIDDYRQFKKPVITPVELDVVLGLKKWDEYVFDEIKGKKK
jgi:2-(3-amino-3-carboxypropyl)histidine synthase